MMPTSNIALAILSLVVVGSGLVIQHQKREVERLHARRGKHRFADGEQEQLERDGAARGGVTAGDDGRAGEGARGGA